MVFQCVSPGSLTGKMRLCGQNLIPIAKSSTKIRLFGNRLDIFCSKLEGVNSCFDGKKDTYEVCLKGIEVFKNVFKGNL